MESRKHERERRRTSYEGKEVVDRLKMSRLSRVEPLSERTSCRTSDPDHGVIYCR